MTADEMVEWHRRSMDMGLVGLRELVMEEGRPELLRFMGSQRMGHD